MSSPDTRAGVDGLKQVDLVQTELQQPEAGGFFDRNRFFTDLRAKSLNTVCALLVAGLSIPLISTLLERSNIQAQNLLFPDPAPKAPLAGGRLVSSYTVEDLQVMGGNRIASLVTESDGQYIVTGDINENLMNRAKVPFLGTAVFASSDGSVLGALGSPAPGMFSGRLGLLENGSISVYDNGEGTITEGAVTPDKTGIIIRAGNSRAGETQYLYQYFDLATRTFRTFDLCAGCVPGSVGFPLTIISPNTLSGYGTGFPDRGYTESLFNTVALTVSTTQWHPEQGYNMSKRLNHFYNPANEHIVWIVNNDTIDSTGRRLGTLYYNTDNIHVLAKDFQPNVPLYAEANALGRLNSIPMSSVAVDTVGGLGFTNPAVNVDNIYYPHTEAFSATNPGDLNQRFLVPEDGDLPSSWPNGGMRGDPGRFVNVLSEGMERNLLRDLRVNETIYNGLYARRITNGITVSDQWRKVTISGGYTFYLPVVMKQAN